jgi:hypothetical protein
MPNICDNRLTIVGPGPELERFKQEAYPEVPDERGRIELLPGKLVPLPEPWNRSDAAQAWGSKWICDTQLKENINDQEYGYLVFDFESAWSPPDEFVRKASMLFPCLRFHIAFWEEWGNYSGLYSYSGGEQEYGILLKYDDPLFPDIAPEEYLQEYVRDTRQI